MQEGWQQQSVNWFRLQSNRIFKWWQDNRMFSSRKPPSCLTTAVAYSRNKGWSAGFTQLQVLLVLVKNKTGNGSTVLEGVIVNYLSDWNDDASSRTPA